MIDLLKGTTSIIEERYELEKYMKTFFIYISPLNTVFQENKKLKKTNEIVADFALYELTYY